MARVRSGKSSGAGCKKGDYHGDGMCRPGHPWNLQGETVTGFLHYNPTIIVSVRGDIVEHN